MSFEEQIMSEGKSVSIFSKSNGGYCISYPSKSYHNARSFENWGIFSDNPQFWLGNILSSDAYRLIARERKCLMDYKYRYTFISTLKDRSYMYLHVLCKLLTMQYMHYLY